MGSTSRPIPSLLNGVSQQPASLRHPTQAELQINGYSSLANGLLKRPAMQWLTKLSAGAYGSSYVSVMNFSDTEQFILVIISGDLFVFDLDGNAQTVNFPTGKAYLGGMSAVGTATVTVEGITYIVNKLATVTMAATVAGGVYKGKVQDFASLPAIPAGGDTYLIVGDGTIQAQGHYMRWNAGTSIWYEAANPGELNTLNAALMPHKLVYDSGTGIFTFSSETWTTRQAGDSVTVPTPSFVNRTINDVFFHRNRLGFLSGEYVILSESGPNYTNFWGKTATALLDSDRIDLRSANVRVSTLNHALPFNRQLAIDSSSSQFILSTAIGQTLTPTAGSLDVSTQYAANSPAKPITVGNSMFFPSQGAQWSSMREYKVRSNSEIVNNAEDITQHIPKYLPANIFKVTVAEEEDSVFMLSSDEPTRIYVYKFYEVDDTNLQTSWSYWQMPDDINILNMEVIDSKLMVVMQRADGVHLGRFNLDVDGTEASIGFPVLLDMRIKPGAVGSYSVVTNSTTWTLPWDNAGLKPLQVILSEDFVSGKGAVLDGVSMPTTTTVTAPGDWTGGRVWIGKLYEFRYRFSEQFLRKSADNTQGSPVLQGTLRLRNFAVRYNATGYMRAEVLAREGGQLFTYVYSGMTLGAASLIIGSPNISKGVFSFPVVADSRKVTIDLVNDTHMPSALTSAEWTANFTSKKGV